MISNKLLETFVNESIIGQMVCKTEDNKDELQQFRILAIGYRKYDHVMGKHDDRAEFIFQRVLPADKYVPRGLLGLLTRYSLGGNTISYIGPMKNETKVNDLYIEIKQSRTYK